jgi:hypothetical protein
MQYQEIIFIISEFVQKHAAMCRNFEFETEWFIKRRPKQLTMSPPAFFHSIYLLFSTFTFLLTLYDLCR